MGLIPLFFILDSVSRSRAAFGWSFLCGLIFFGGIIHWIRYVTFAGYVLMVLYLAAYFGLFGWMYFYLRRLSGMIQWVALPAAWVLMEFLQSRLLTGFSWAALGLTQYEQILLIQIADWGGVFAVSFMLVLGNLLLKYLGECFYFKRWGCFYKAFFFSVFFGVLVMGYGVWRMSGESFDGEWKTAVIQGSIDLDTSWRQDAWMSIIDTYLDLSRKSVVDKPDMLIWPETAFPAMLWEDEIFLMEIKQFIQNNQMPLLFGSVVRKDNNYYNAAILMSAQGRSVAHYFKNHLVPYGEYIPFREYVPWLSYFIPIDDFTAGMDAAVLSIPGRNKSKFSVLICFEDTVASLVREFVLNGAEVLVNMTNDAWFLDSKEPLMHLQSSVFRAVEYKRSVIRAANTGISAFIDPLGRIKAIVEDENGNTVFVSGYQVQSVPLNRDLTLYALFGDFFAFWCSVVAMATLIFALVQKKLKQNPIESHGV